MPRDKKILYALAVLTPVGLLSIVLTPLTLCIPLAAVWLAVALILAHILIKKRRAPSLNRGTVLLIMLVALAMYFMLFYLSGLFLGYIKSSFLLNATLVWHRLLPTALIIAASELIRRILLSQEGWVSALFAFFIGFFSELAIVGGLRDLPTFNAAMDLLGMTLLPAISAGLLYQYVSAQHGALPAVAYRLVFTLFPYFIPVTPNIPDALASFIALFFPFLLLLFLRALFEKKRKRATTSPRAKWVEAASLSLFAALAIGVIALVSGQFRYATIVIATGSMTGELNVGDMAVYERYDGQDIREGDIIVFERDRALIVHRVVEITHINAQTRYYTKGDANEARDVGFITSADIVGITDFKVSYIGFPTLWMHRLLDFGS